MANRNKVGCDNIKSENLKISVNNRPYSRSRWPYDLRPRSAAGIADLNSAEVMDVRPLCLMFVV